MIRRLFCIALVLLLPAAGYSRGEKVLLQYRQETGETLEYRSELDASVIVQQLGGWVKGEGELPRTIIYRKELDFSVEVLGRSRGEINMLYRFGRGFIEERRGPGAQKREIDLTGKDIRIKMRPNGRAEVENMGELEDVFRRTGAPALEEPLFPVFPKKRLRVGAAWKQKFTRRGLVIEGKPITYVVRYRLAGIEERGGMRCAVIEGSGTLKLENYHGQTRKGKKVDIIESEEDIESVIYFAVDRGIPVESRKTIRRHEIREWSVRQPDGEARGDKEPYKDEMTTEVVIRNFLVGAGER